MSMVRIGEEKTHTKVTKATKVFKGLDK